MTTPPDAMRLVPTRATPQQLEAAAFNLSAEIGAEEAVKLAPHIERAYELLVAAAPASPLPEGGVEALIAELKEARGLLQGFVSDEDDAVRNPLGGLSLGGLMDARDNTGCVYQSAALADRIVQSRAFLARNGKGEG